MVHMLCSVVSEVGEKSAWCSVAGEEGLNVVLVWVGGGDFISARMALHVLMALFRPWSLAIPLVHVYLPTFLITY